MVWTSQIFASDISSTSTWIFKLQIYMLPSTLELKMEVPSDGKKWYPIPNSHLKKGWYIFHKKSSSDIILAFLWQSEGLAFPSVAIGLYVSLDAQTRIKKEKKIGLRPVLAITVQVTWTQIWHSLGLALISRIFLRNFGPFSRKKIFAKYSEI